MNKKITLFKYILVLFLTTVTVCSTLSLCVFPTVKLQAKPVVKERMYIPIPLTYTDLAKSAAFQCRVPHGMAMNLIETESHWDHLAISSSNARGLTQIIPSTAKYYQINYLNPNDNLIGGLCYFRRMFDRYNSFEVAATAYHAGPGNVDRGNIGPKTRAYQKRLMAGYTKEEIHSLDKQYKQILEINF